MEKKMYYIIDNGDTPVICDLQALIDMLQAESGDYNEQKTKEDEPEWTIRLTWLTDEEYENLPEAY